MVMREPRHYHAAWISLLRYGEEDNVIPDGPALSSSTGQLNQPSRMFDSKSVKAAGMSRSLRRARAGDGHPGNLGSPHAAWEALRRIVGDADLIVLSLNCATAGNWGVGAVSCHALTRRLGETPPRHFQAPSAALLGNILAQGRGICGFVSHVTVRAEPFSRYSIHAKALPRASERVWETDRV